MSSETLTDRPTEVDFDEHTPENMVDAYRHEDGSITYIVIDTDGYASIDNPREWARNIAVLIQRNDRYIKLDDDEAGLGEAWDHFYGYGEHGTTAPRYGRTSRLDRTGFMLRYIAIYRPDIAYYTGWWSGDGMDGSYGWGYVTTAAWEEAGITSFTPEQAFDAEVKVYSQWANGEVYGSIHVSVGEPIVKFWDHGAYIDGYETEEDSCWGHLGYDDHKDIALQFTDSPITEVLA